MNKRTLTASLVLIVAMMACNLPSKATDAQATDMPVTATETSVVPSNTPLPTLTSLPTDTPIPTATPTPLIPIAWPLDKGVNCRFGPGLEWATIGSLLVGQTAQIQAKNADATWWFVTTQNDPGKPCWVAASVTVTAGNLANLPVFNPPVGSVTDISVKLDPNEISLPGCLGPVQPITFKGTITVNGPTNVDWHFETEQGGSMSVHTTNFKNADTKNIEDSYTPAPTAGNYWVRLVVTSPNGKTVEAKYKIVCPP